MDNQQENISKYLDNEMSKNERLDFENQMRKNKSLAQDVDFQRNLHGFLKRDNPVLEQKLSNLGDEFIINKKEKKRTFSYWIVLFILFIGLLITYFSFFNITNDLIENDIKNPPKIEEIIPIDDIEKGSDNIIEDSIKEIETPVKNPPSKPEKITPEKQPIAVLDEKIYARNAMMEDVIAANYRTDEKEDFVIVSIPEEDAIFKYSEQILFTVKGSSTNDNNYQLIIYSNRDFDIENDHKILDVEIDDKLAKDKYLFDFNANISLEKGLYYFIIRKNGTRDVLYISRFTVE